MRHPSQRLQYVAQDALLLPFFRRQIEAFGSNNRFEVKGKTP